MRKLVFKGSVLMVIVSVLCGGAFAKASQIEFPTYSAHANEISIAYQAFGNPQDEALVLVMGLGGQLIHWDDRFVQLLVDRGFRVIRFDNRDAGWSEHLHGAGAPGLFTFLRYKLGFDVGAPYSLDDMAADTVGLMDHLNIEKAHVMGMSMGGMIAQIVAADYPSRVLSLTSIMSTSGAAHLPQTKLDIAPRDRSEMSRQEIIEEGVNAFQVIDGPGDLVSEDEWRSIMSRSYDRSHYDEGFSRQLWAILGSGDRVEKLKTIKAPTLVVHGTGDPLVLVEGGKHTAELVEGSELLLIDGMGHALADIHFEPIVSAFIKRLGR